MKKIFALLLTLCMCIFQTNVVLAVSNNTKSEDQIQEMVADILNDYQSKQAELLSLNLAENLTMDRSAQKQNILQETKQKLTELGCEVYLLEQESFEQVEEFLQTDLEEIGLDREASYMLVVNGAEVTPYGTAGSQFSYTYGGKTYTMRYLTVIYTDDEAWSNYYQFTEIDLLKNPTLSALQSFLNTGIQLYTGSKGGTVQNIGTLVGTAIDSYNTTTAAKFSMDFTCYSIWTRVYTQVWSSYDQVWSYGSSVESVKVDAHVDGYKYKPAINAVEGYKKTVVDTTKYSSRYSDTTWRKQQAAIAAASSSPCISDKTGNISYHYVYANGYDEVFVTHYNNF